MLLDSGVIQKVKVTHTMAAIIEVPVKLLTDLEEELDSLIQVIDYEPESIADNTTESARALLLKLRSYIS